MPTEVKLEAVVDVIKASRSRFALPALITLCVGLLSTGLAQDAGNYRMAPNKLDTEIDILANYYEQDGDFGAPQGGLGTEELSNVAGIVVVQVPLDSNSAVSATLGADYYSSASTDRIDYQLSTASAHDLRGYLNIGYTERQLDKGRTYGVRLGASFEYDYESINGGLSFAQEWNRGQDELSFGLQVFNDRWDLIYPLELRTPGAQFSRLDSRGRQSYGLSIAYARILTPRIQLAVTSEFVAMRGLLSTPFHRIYFQGSVDPASYVDEARRQFPADDIERLPSERYKLPVSLRANVKIGDNLSLRTFGRYYADTWGVRGISGDVEFAYNFGGAWTVLPYARYYSQQGADYYAGFAQHLPGEAFYTSDFDLATLTTTKIGLGLRYAPLFGIARTRFANRGFEWRQLVLRGSYFSRDPGLEAYSVTLSTSMTLRQAK